MMSSMTPDDFDEEDEAFGRCFVTVSPLYPIWYIYNCYSIVIILSSFTEECNWTEREYQLAAWGFRKWRYHQFTSLRVGPLPSACVSA